MTGRNLNGPAAEDRELSCPQEGVVASHALLTPATHLTPDQNTSVLADSSK